jgi:putative ABC transport system ATP-binding protein
LLVALHATSAARTHGVSDNAMPRGVTDPHDPIGPHSELGTGESVAHQPLIVLEGLHKSYRSGDSTLHVLKDVDLTINRGQLVSIMGSSGSGKSTLLNVLGILDEYDAGTYHLGGQLVRGLSERQAARYRNRFIGFVFQSFNLLPFKTALENVALPLFYQGVSRRRRNQIALEYLEKVNLADRKHHLPSELSGGQKQRVAIARALIAKPKLILADEPTGALDTETSYRLMDLFREIHQQGITIVIVTHEHDISERTDRRIVLKDGRVDHESC